jgi:uncharacterized protein YggE
MNKTIQLIILTLLFSSNINAQSTERFIRIIGNSKKMISADKGKVYFSINEIKASKYDKNSNEIKYDTIYKQVISKLSEFNIAEGQLQKALNKRNKYNQESKNFYIETDLNNLEKISNISIKGFSITETVYIYQTKNENLETELSLEAIKDAKRKAKAICKSIDMKLGNILNIEVKEGDFPSSSIEKKDIKSLKTYKVTITFNLID